MYSISGYGRMMADSMRMDAYTKALRQAVKPDSIVLDIGTGTGIFAVLACQFGAPKVYAIEPDAVIQVAREIAIVNGYAERIEFMQKLSTQVKLPEQVDVIISDLRGVLPLFQHHLPAIADARQRFLKPGGVLIPQRDVLWTAVVEAPDLYNHYVTPWDDNGYGLNMAAARQIVTNTWRKGRATPEQLLVEPQVWATLDYATVESPDISAEVSWTVMRAGTAHGLSVWFDAILAEDIGFSNAPDAPELIYGGAFFPWSKPVTLAVGDTISVVLQADLVGDDYFWRWDTHVLNQGHLGQIKANFKQSTFFGAPLSPAQLRKQAASHVPALNEDGQIDHFILKLMSSSTVLNDIAREVSAQFSTHFPRWQDALTRIGELSQKYSQ
jgi:protein arginine N-methyltransferase 1